MVLVSITNTIPRLEEIIHHRRKKRRRLHMRTINWATHEWTTLLNHPDTREINSLLGKRFRIRFRIPASFFLDWLVPTCKKANLFEDTINLDGRLRQTPIPIEIKLLICLRILARGVTSDDVSEPSGVSRSHCHMIFQKFIHRFPLLFKNSFISLPNQEQLKGVMNVYAAMGFPGCVGSVDCTHVRWWNCPRELQNSCRGKEGFPTLVFQVVVDHSKRIIFVSNAFFGSLNDRNVCDADGFIFNNNNGILNTAGTERILYKDLVYDVYDRNGDVITLKGGVEKFSGVLKHTRWSEAHTAV